MEDPQGQLDQQQESERKLFIRIPNEILEDERLTATDKLVYGRGFSFKRFYESAEATGKALGICPNQVKISKRKLEKLGFFVMYENTGRGKKYFVQEPDYRESENDPQTYRGSKSDPQTNRKESSQGQNLTPENKERLKEEESLSLKDKSFKESSEPTSENEESLKEESEKPKRYGKAEINEILDEWEAATDFQWHGVRQERFAVNTLLRKFGLEATKALVRRVRTARRSDDQFAPQIVKPSQLVGKYEKLTALTMWEERCARIKSKAAEMEGPDFRKLYNMGELPENEPDDYAPEYTAEEKQNRRDFVSGLREKYGFKRKEADNE